MVVKSLTIENFKSYYGKQTFEFANGFNVVLGDNGEGKTKLIESIRWFLSGLTSDGGENLVSRAALKDLKLNVIKAFEVSVEIDFIDDSRHRRFTVKKVFSVSNKNEGHRITDIHYEGVESNVRGEKIFHHDALFLLKEAVPEPIRPYTVFQGESELNILDTSSASIERLLNVFINESLLKSLQLKAQKIQRKAEIAVEKEASKNKKNAKLLGNLQESIRKTELNIDKLSKRLIEFEKDRDISEKRMLELNDILAQAEEFDKFRNELAKLNLKRGQVIASLKEDYTTYIFDDKYLLNDFRHELEKFNSSIEDFEAEQRKLELQFQRKKGEENAVTVIQSALIGNSNPLPVGVPSKNYMEEMINDEICKVCNRSAVKGSEEYEYMKAHMSAILKKISQSYSDTPVEVLFKSDNIKSLHVDLSKSYSDRIRVMLSDKKAEFKELQKFNMSRYKEIAEIDRSIEDFSDKITSITGFTGLQGDTLSRHLKDWHHHSNNFKERVKTIERLKNQISEFENHLSKYKKEQNKIIGSSEISEYLLNARNIARKQSEIFREIRRKDVHVILSLLEKKTNEIFEKLNVHAFKGSLRINGGLNEHSNNISVNIDHVVNDGEIFTGANQALETSANISLLLAVMEISEERNIGTFPIFMDAPVSSFGKKKIGQFMQVMNSINNQCIVVMKEYLEPNGDDVRVSDDFEELRPNKAFWIKLTRPFDKQDLSTVKTKVYTL